MKLPYLFVFVNCFATNVFAQDKSTIPSISIPRTETNSPVNPSVEPQYSISKPFVPEKFKTAPKFEPISMDKSMEMKPQVSDLNVGKQYANKMNKANAPKEGGADSKAFRRDQYFGEYVTESATISISYLDFGIIDADRIRIKIDGQTVADVLELDGYEKRVYVGLIEGINYLEIEAINEGTLTPNTGQFTLIDEAGKVLTSDQWYLSTGFKAVFNIRRVSKGNLSTNDKK